MQTNSDMIRRLEPIYHSRRGAPCNLDCFYCYEKPHPIRTAKDFQNRLKDDLLRAKAAEYSTMVYGSGEFFIIPDYSDLLHLASDFEQVWVLSNLTAINQSKLETAAEAGLSGVVGTLFAVDDAGAKRISGVSGVYSRQQKAISRIAAHPKLNLSLHIMLTGELISDPLSAVLDLKTKAGLSITSIMISAIEPISAAVSDHPAYRTGLDLDWNAIFETAEAEGLFLVVQNIPACRLGRWAHRSYIVRKRIGRILKTWPSDPNLASFVDRAESLAGRLQPVGPCCGCKLVSVCHRYFDYQLSQGPKDALTAGEVIRRIEQEEGLSLDSVRLSSDLETIENRRL